MKNFKIWKGIETYFGKVSKQFESILNAIREDTSNIGFSILLRGQLELMKSMIQIPGARL
jgi:hypothetical protein